jgi:hypothetical protein
MTTKRKWIFSFMSKRMGRRGSKGKQKERLLRKIQIMGVRFQKIH